MTDKIEIQGKTVDAAVSEALLQMGARRDEVEIKVLEEPKSGFLGMLGGRPARVLVRKKRGRRGGGRQDHRREEDGYQFGGGGGSRSRNNRGRRGGGRRDDQQDDGRRDARGGGRDSERSGGRDDNRRGSRGRGRKNEGRNDNQDVRAEEQKNERRDSGRSGGRDSGRDSARNDGERKPTRRGSRGGRGRGGRGRKQDAVAQDQQRDQQRDQQQQDQQGRGNERSRGRRQEGRDNVQADDRQEQRQSRSRRGQRGGGRQDEARQESRSEARNENRNDRRDDSHEAARDVNPREERSRRSRRPAAEVAPNEAPAPVQDTPREEAPVVNEAKDVRKVQSVAEVHPIRRAADVKKAKTDGSETAAAPAKKRGFGGLGSRRKSKLESAARKAETREAAARKAEEDRANDTSAMDAAAARAAERPGEIRRKAAPEGSEGAGSGGGAPARERAPRREMRSTREPGDEVIIADVEATSYAKPVDAPEDEAALETLKELTTGMLARAGFQCDVETRPDEYSQVIVSTDEENAGMLIGRHGQSVEAVEHLVERMASNAAGDRVRMNLDINEYRVRRQEALLERTREACDDVLDSGRAYHMEPMSARERRIVHMGCADVEGIRTFTMMGSRGKQVVIAVDDGEGDQPADDPVFTED